MKFASNPERRLLDLERKVQSLESAQAGRNYGSRGSNPIGWRVPWVRHSLVADDTGSNQTLFLEPSTASNGWFGSEVDTLIHRMPENGSNGQRGFQIVGRGTWLMYVWVNFSYSLLTEGSARLYLHYGHLWPSYSASFITPLGRAEQQDHTLLHVGFLDTGILFSKTMQFCWPFNVQGNVTPAAPQELYLRFLSPERNVRSSGLTLGTKLPTDAVVMFVRLDSEAKRDVEILLAGDGVEEIEPPPPGPTPNPDENFPGGPPPP